MTKKRALSVLVAIVIMASILFVSPVQAFTTDDFQIGIFYLPFWDYTNDTQYDYIKDAHVNFITTFYPNGAINMSTVDQMNTVLSLANARGIGVQVSDSRNGTLTDQNIDAIASSYKNNPATAGYYVRDEPPVLDFPTSAYQYRRFLENDPDSIPNVNMTGASPEVFLSNVNYFVDLVGSGNLKYLTYDSYPYYNSVPIEPNYYTLMSIVRSVGLSRNIRTGCYLQSIGSSTTSGLLRRPNGNEMRLDAFTSVAYGMKALYWFTWFKPIMPDNGFSTAIFDEYGNKTDLYAPAQQINGEIEKLGPTLMGLTSRDVYFKGTRPAGTTLVPSNYFWNPTTGYDQIISHFVNANGRSYVMVVNRDYTNSRTLTFNLPTKPSSVTEVSKTTGAEVATNYSSSTGNISASFLPGEGRLYAISTDFTVNSLTVDNKDKSITYGGSSWFYSPNRSVGDYEDDLYGTTANNDYFQYTFKGTGIDYITEKELSQGNIDIYIDGVFQQTVSANGSIPNQPLQTIYSKTGLPYGTHTIKGIKKSGVYMTVDAFKVYTTSNIADITTTNDDSPTATYTGSSWTVDSNRGVGNYRNDLHVATTNGDYVEYKFTGTSVSFISEKTPGPGYGDIDVYIDGVFQQTVSCVGTVNNQPQQAVYSKTGLTYGMHTLKCVKKSGIWMTVDGFSK